MIIWFQIIQINYVLFDDYLIDYLIDSLWLFGFDHLIIVMIICYLFDDYFSESLIIWWLFDAYLMIILIIWWLFAVSLRLIAVLIPQQRPMPPAISLSCWACLHCGYKLSATWSQAAMERQILSHQQDLASSSALAAAQALLRRDDPLDPWPWTPTSD